MSELFPTEVPILPPVEKKFYKAGDGKFTDPTTARVDQAEKECKIHKQNEAYYKRQNERLIRELEEETKKRKELEKQLGYGEGIKRIDNNNIRRVG